MDPIDQLEKRLWGAADLLRANSNLNSSEYMMPVLGILFLGHAYSRFLAVRAEIEPTLPTRGGVPLPLTKDHFTRKAALFLRPEAQFDYLLNLPGDRNLGKALNDAMTAIEEDYPTKLMVVLPKDYARLGDDLLQQLLKIFNDDALRRSGEDAFGRINEYFLLKFAMARAQDEGEFFTPPALTQLITRVIEPDHGILWDPAFGSGGMFVQAGHYVAAEGLTGVRQQRKVGLLRWRQEGYKSAQWLIAATGANMTKCGEVDPESRAGSHSGDDALKHAYTSVVKRDTYWWISWVDEVPGKNGQEDMREEILESLRITLADAMKFNRIEARSVASGGYEELLIAE